MTPHTLRITLPDASFVTPCQYRLTTNHEVEDGPTPRSVGMTVELDLTVPAERLDVLDFLSASTRSLRPVAASELVPYVAVELWEEARDLSERPVAWCYTLFPRLKDLEVHGLEVSSDSASFLLGAAALNNPEWTGGPYDVVLGPDGAPSRLHPPLNSRTHMHFRLTELAPPTE